MADVKISQLPAAVALTGAEAVPVVQGGVTVQTTATAVINQTTNTANFKGITFGTLGVSSATGAIFMGTGNIDVVSGHIFTNGAFGCNTASSAQTAATVNAAVASTATTNAAPWGFTTQAQGDNLVALVNQIRAALVANGICQ